MPHLLPLKDPFVIAQNHTTQLIRGESDQYGSVVIKCCQPSVSDAATSRLLFSGQVLQRFDHPGIVKILGSFDEEHPELIMEDIDGIDLHQYLSSLQSHQLPLETFLNIATQLADALSVIHHEQVIHRDLHPGNMVINPKTEQVQIIDFGLASLLTREQPALAPPETLEGMLPYISPEQTGRMNRALDYRTDFYTLGVTFYQLLTGELPFEADDAIGWVHAHIAKVAVPVCERRPDVPEVLSAIIDKLMHKTAELRYQSALGLKHDLSICLRAVIAGEEIPCFSLGLHDIPDRFQIPQVLYGREAEIEQLMASFYRAAKGQPQLLAVDGVAGIGKSALIHEVHKPIAAHHGLFISGKFDQFQKNVPYSALKQAFKGWIQQALMLNEQALTKLREELTFELGNNARVLIDFIAEFQLVLGDLPAVPELGAQESQNRFYLTLQRFMLLVTRHQPLVIFIDDLQWADHGTLNLLPKLLASGEADKSFQTSNESSCRLLLLVAYRNNEVDAAHPAMNMLEGLRQTQNATKKTFKSLSLAPLTEAQVVSVLMDALRQTAIAVNPLAELVHRKTAGNPFFIIEFLKTLYNEHLLDFDLNTTRWVWDLAAIEKKAITDNVVKLMLDKMEQLPEASQALLHQAACIGSLFDLETLAVISDQSLTEVVHTLWPALKEGLLLQEGGDWLLGVVEPRDASQTGSSRGSTRLSNAVPQCRFLHDRMLQAAYESQSVEARQHAHLHIGRLLLAHAQAQTTEQDNALEHQLFAIVEQLNQGRGHITNADEQLQLAQLNLRAAENAKTAGVWVAAKNYAEIGIALLPSTCWQGDQTLAYRLHLLYIECKSLALEYVGLEAEAEAEIEALITRLDSNLRKARVCFLSATHFTLSALEKALNAGFRGLAFCGSDTKAVSDITFDLVEQERCNLSELMKNKKHCSEKALLPCTPDVELGFRLFAQLAAIAQVVGKREILEYVAYQGMQLAMQHEANEHSVIIEAVYAVSLAQQGAYHEARQVAENALALLKQFPSCPDVAFIYMTLSTFVVPFYKPLSRAVDYQLKAHETGYEVGDLVRGVFAGYSNSMINRYAMGESLAEQKRCSQQLDAILTKFGFAVFAGRYYQRLIDMLMGTTQEDLLSCSAFDSEEWQKIQSSVIKPFIDHLQLQWYFWSDQSQKTLEVAVAAEASLPLMTGFITCTEHRFLRALLACRLPATPEHQAIITESLKELETLSDLCPENFEHKWLLLQAEQGRYQDASTDVLMPLYNQAIESARANGFLQYTALANELYAAFWLDKQHSRIAQSYFLDAMQGYRAWGCAVKVKRLQGMYEQFFEASSLLDHSLNDKSLQEVRRGLKDQGPTVSASEVSSSSSRKRSYLSNEGTDQKTRIGSSEFLSNQQGLDLSSVMKSAQAISSELEVKGLLAKVMAVIVENSGAQVGAFVLNNAKQAPSSATIEAFINIDAQDRIELHSRSLDSAEDLPVSLINYVLRTDNDLVFQNGTQDSVDYSFIKDEYLKQRLPQSVMCLPIDYRDKTIGALYLENTLSSNAFPKERLGVIKLLLAQAAISFENARLFEEVTDLNEGLERKVEERTQALQDAQSKLLEAEKMASLGEVVRGVAHEMNTPLGIATTASSVVSDAIDELETKFNDKKLTTSYLRHFIENSKGSTELLNNNLRRSSELVQLFKRISVDEVVESVRDFILSAELLMLADQCVPLLSHGQHDLVVECDDGIHLTSYPEVLSNVLEQLIQNAVIHGFENSTQGRIELTASVSQPEGDYVQIQVRDNGCGMPAEMVEKVFDPFVTTKRGALGKIGLGNHIVYNLVTQKLNGTILCESTEGEGTCFTLCFPYL
jgi:predicted ATPase/signal transduction histidine kinase